MSLQIANTTRHKLNEALLRKTVRKVIEAEGCRLGSVAAVYCGNRMIRRINREFLSHDYVTDTITFRYNEGPVIEGEFYISLDVILQNSLRFRTAFGEELLRVTIHSALHLVGYEDASPEQRAAMSRREDDYLLLVAGG